MAGIPIPRAQSVIIFKKFTDLVKAGKGRLEAAEILGEEYGYEGQKVYQHILRLEPTRELAKLVLEAGVAKLAKRIVAKASVQEAIEVLSRPNINILEPKKSEEMGRGGFFMNVTVETLGAVTGGSNGRTTPTTDLEVLPWRPAERAQLVSGEPARPHPEPDSRQGPQAARDSWDGGVSGVDVEIEEQGTADVASDDERERRERPRHERDQRPTDANTFSTGRVLGRSKKFQEALEAGRLKLEKARAEHQKYLRSTKKSRTKKTHGQQAQSVIITDEYLRVSQNRTQGEG